VNSHNFYCYLHQATGTANIFQKEGADDGHQGFGHHEPAFGQCHCCRCPNHFVYLVDYRIFILAVGNLLDQVECGLRRRDSAFLRGVFSRLSEGRPFLTKHQLPQALNEVGIEIEGEDVCARSAVADCGDLLTVEEFLQLTRKLYKSNEWSGLLDLHELLLDALPQSSSEHPLRVISELSTEEVSCVCEAYCHGLKEVLKKFSNQLRVALDQHFYSERDIEDSDKDKIERSKFALALPEPGHTDVLDKMHEYPLDGLIRSQFKLAQEHATVIYDNMETEHCRKPDSDIFFDSSSGETNPRKEWMAVIQCRSEVSTNDRKVPDISDLAISKCGSMMTKEEIISVVLYTGPMVRRPQQHSC
jgi:hypothetical protein